MVYLEQMPHSCQIFPHAAYSEVYNVYNVEEYNGMYTVIVKP